MADALIIRQLHADDDLAAATHLLQRFFKEENFVTPETTIAANTKRLASLDVCGLFLAEHGNSAIGVATVSMEFGIEYGWSAEMGDLYIVPEWRGKGISRKLVEAVESFLLQKGARGYQVTVTSFAAEHHDLSKFYNRIGFEDEGRVLLFRKIG